MMVFVSGVYEHTCPGCDRTTVFTVNNVTHMSMRGHTSACDARPMDYVVHRPSQRDEVPPSNPMHAFGQGRGD